MRRGPAVGALLALVAGPSLAFVDIKSEYGANIVISNTQSIGVGATRSGTVVTSTANIVGPGGGTVPARVAVSMSGRAIITAASRMLPAVAAASLAYDLWTSMRWKQENGQTLFDPGVAEKMLTSYGCGYGNKSVGYSYASPQSACSAVVSKFNVSNVDAGCARYSDSFSVGGPGPFPESFNVYFTRVYTIKPGYGGIGQPECTPAPGGTELAGQAFYSNQMALRCEFGQKSWLDGLCQSTEEPSYPQVLTPDEAGEKYDKANKDNAPPHDLGGILGEAMGNITGNKPMPAVNQPHTVTEPYPAEVAGGKTITQNPDGTVTEVATGWNIRPAFEFPTNPGKSTWNKTTTTTQKDSQGNVVSQSTTTEKPSVDAPTAEDKCPPDSDRAGCANLGKVDDVELGSKEVNVSVTPMDGWGAGAGACPQPATVQVAGFTIPIDNTLVCRFLELSRPLLVAVAGLVAALIVLGGLKD